MKIGIITAMQEEYEAIEKIVQEKRTKQILGINFIEGIIKNKECVLVQCGVGKVNAARTTQIMIDNFEIECIFNLGSAGAINNELKIGDVVIGKNVYQHDFDITAFNHNKGYVPGVGDKIECDKNLVNKFEQTIKNIKDKNYQIKIGAVATGDIFLTEEWMKNKIRKKFDADIVDMECGAIAQVAYLDNIPVIVVRSISDVPNGENGNTFDENLELASERAAEVLVEFFK